MKTFFKKIHLLFIVGLVISSCSSEVVPQNSELKNDANSEQLRPFTFTFDARADFMYVVSPGCFMVNVRVYFTDLSTGQVSLVANQDVQIGDCEGSGSGNRIQEGQYCEGGYLPNGDYVIPKRSSAEYCLLELLSRNEELYTQYLELVEEIISNNIE